MHQYSGEKVDKCGRPVVYIFAAKHNKNERDLNEIKKMIIYTLEQVLPPLPILPQFVIDNDIIFCKKRDLVVVGVVIVITIGSTGSSSWW